MSDKFCPECGSKVISGAKFCPECGCKIAGKSTEPLFDFSEDTSGYDDAAFGGFDKMLKSQSAAKEEKKTARLKQLSAFEYEEHTNGTFSIVSLKDGNVLDVVVPEGVTSILPEAFMDKEVIGVTLPEGLMQIGDRAFKGCKNLMKINFPASLMIVGDEAFAECESLEATLPSTVKKVGKNTMKNTLPDVAKQREAARRKAEEEKRKAEEAAIKKAEADKRAAEEDKRKAEEAARKYKEAIQRATDDAARKQAEAEARKRAEEQEWENALNDFKEGRYKQAFDVFLKRKAFYYLAVCFENGWGTEKRISAAVRYYDAAAQQGNADAMYAIGRIYENGDEVGVDCRAALNWMKRAADNGHKEAQKAIEGLTEKADWERIQKEWRGSQPNKELLPILKKFAEKGNAEAQYKLGSYYSNAWTWDDSCIDWLQKAAEQGNLDASYSLGYIYQTGGRGHVKKDFRKAVYWYRKAAGQGGSIANHAAQRLKEAEKDLEELIEKEKEELLSAISFYKSKRYADSGIPTFKQYAEEGNAMAQYYLGLCYEDGRGIERDLEKAAYWYQKALEQGHSEAGDRLKKVMKKLK